MRFPWAKLVVFYTNGFAGVQKDKLRLFLSHQLDQLSITTFHNPLVMFTEKLEQITFYVVTAPKNSNPPRLPNNCIQLKVNRPGFRGGSTF